MNLDKHTRELLKRIRAERPVIHCITNEVTVNDCANILHAVWASPVMAHHPLEVEEITSGASALVCNMGAITEFEAMERAAREARRLGHAIVVDPVGVSGSHYRREQCEALIRIAHPTCIRGNYSEIRALMQQANTGTGVDAKSGDTELNPEQLKAYAAGCGAIVIASGARDLITDGKVLDCCDSGDPMMTRITGSGCMSSALLGAFLGIEPTLESAVCCCELLGRTGAQAAERTQAEGAGTMTFRTRFIDLLSVSAE